MFRKEEKKTIFEKIILVYGLPNTIACKQYINYIIKSLSFFKVKQFSYLIKRIQRRVGKVTRMLL